MIQFVQPRVESANVSDLQAAAAEQKHSRVEKCRVRKEVAEIFSNKICTYCQAPDKI